MIRITVLARPLPLCEGRIPSHYRLERDGNTRATGVSPTDELNSETAPDRGGITRPFNHNLAAFACHVNPFVHGRRSEDRRFPWRHCPASGGVFYGCTMLNLSIKLLAFLAISLALVEWEALASNPVLGGGSGSSPKTAIVIHASSAAIGIRAQDGYLKAHYPGYRFVGHAFTFHNGRWYDIVLFTDARGRKRSLYFDISEYFKAK
jgi:hypothetical protein